MNQGIFLIVGNLLFLFHDIANALQCIRKQERAGIKIISTFYYYLPHSLILIGSGGLNQKEKESENTRGWDFFLNAPNLDAHSLWKDWDE